MKLLETLAEAVSLVLLICAVVGLMFLFWGEPDVFDRLRDEAMGVCK